MNTENLILRTATHSPLTTKGTYLVTADFDDNNINIYEDFVNLATSSEIADYNASNTYDDTLDKYCTYNGRTYQYVNASPTMGNLPTDTDFFVEIFPTELAHQKNRDTILDEGGVNETSASEIRAFIDAGLTSTTNLSISGHTANSLVIESSTGTDVTLLQASSTAAGLLTATNKIKLDNLSGINSGDQTLASLNAEDVDNKVNDFTTINSVLYPTTEAVDAYITSQVPTLVDASLTGVELQSNKNATNGYVGKSAGKIIFMDFDNLYPSYFYNANTAGRTYTFQDRDGILADNTDLALKVDKATFPVSETLALSDETTALTAGTAKITVRIPYAFTLTGVRASLTTAQTSGSIFTVDINQDGVSVLSTKLTIDNGEKISTTAATPAVISTSAFTDYSEITIDIDQIGDGTAKGLKVSLIGTRSI